MKKVVSIIFEWKYAPLNYLEEEISVTYSNINLSIGNGVAKAILEPVEFDSTSTILDDLTKIVESRLHGVQLLTHQDYTLSRPSRIDLREDGTRNIYMELEPAVVKMTGSILDIVVRDKDGKVKLDTKHDRLERQKWFAEGVARYKSIDETFNQMLLSYQMAIKDPDNEFVYLYEIRDAIASRFKNKKNGLKQLGIVEKDWNLLGVLANQRNVKQSRHRGEFAGVLREAYASELEIARKIAVSFIEKYITYLDLQRIENA